jgi:hypothetical protein
MVGRPRVSNRFYRLNCWRFLLRMLTQDQTRSSGESGGPSVGKGGESGVES